LIFETRLGVRAALSVFRTLAACGVGASERADERGETEVARHCAALMRGVREFRGAITRFIADWMGLGMNRANSDNQHVFFSRIVHRGCKVGSDLLIAIPVMFVPTRQIQRESPGAHALFEAKAHGLLLTQPRVCVQRLAGTKVSTVRKASYDAEP
jgi:hypothetical protein